MIELCQKSFSDKKCITGAFFCLNMILYFAETNLNRSWINNTSHLVVEILVYLIF